MSFYKTLFRIQNLKKSIRDIEAIKLEDLKDVPWCSIHVQEDLEDLKSRIEFN